MATVRGSRAAAALSILPAFTRFCCNSALLWTLNDWCMHVHAFRFLARCAFSPHSVAKGQESKNTSHENHRASCAAPGLGPSYLCWWSWPCWSVRYAACLCFHRYLLSIAASVWNTHATGALTALPPHYSSRRDDHIIACGGTNTPDTTPSPHGPIRPEILFHRL